MSKDWTRLGACELGRMIGRGEIDPVDLVGTFLGCIEDCPDKNDIYARVTLERAHSEAEAASRRAGKGMRLSLLDGVPISWKDIFDTAGTRTEAGTLLLKDRIPAQDAEVLYRATALGLVCLGKTHLSEFAFSGLGLNPVTGTPRCVNNRNAVAGGSSSGAAASVACGLAAAGIGSDTGGSVRVPAVFNDLVGLKTTSGLLPLEGVVPLCKRFDTVGPLARNVEDASAILSALSGIPDPPDLAGARMDRMRFLVLENAMEGVREEPLRGFTNAVEAVRGMGARVTVRSIDAVDKAWKLSGCLYGVEAAGQWMDVIQTNPELMFSEVRKRFTAGLAYSGTDYVKAWSQLYGLRQEFRLAVSGFDAVLAPTSPILPPDKDRLLEDSDFHTTENLLALRNTRIGNLMETTALTLPTGVPSAGVMLLGRPFDEAGLLKIGLEFEKALK